MGICSWQYLWCDCFLILWRILDQLCLHSCSLVWNHWSKWSVLINHFFSKADFQRQAPTATMLTSLHLLWEFIFSRELPFILKGAHLISTQLDDRKSFLLLKNSTNILNKGHIHFLPCHLQIFSRLDGSLFLLDNHFCAPRCRSIIRQRQGHQSRRRSGNRDCLQRVVCRPVWSPHSLDCLFHSTRH